jgi:CRISPR-associated protein Cas2
MSSLPAAGPRPEPEDPTVARYVVASQAPPRLTEALAVAEKVREALQVYKTMLGFGEHVQLSVFRCDLAPIRLIEMRMALDAIIHHDEDQILIIRVGPSGEKTLDRFEVMGRPREFRLPSSIVV